jgi:hypothetical protein
MQDPSPDDLAKEWTQIAGTPIDSDALASLTGAIEAWSSGRLATGSERSGKPVIVSWQRVGGSTYITFR